ncbi:GNAT family N-acetyltransferase [Mycobacterium sp.]|uniref:GNAT family N-acetyltransferase n=1 Tax=Mycobacterium sp. TaxID=1785 RepID=UPI003C750D1A
MESLARIAKADSVDIAELAEVAARTFPLACPPSVTPANIAAFVDANLSGARFSEYLADPQRLILTATQDDRIVGYAMLIRGVGDDPEAAVELSKIYVLPEHHGSGISTALMDAALTATIEWGAGSIWLGVNQKNSRAQRFYEKCGFTINGVRTFQLGTDTEDDYVMLRQL